MKWLLHCTMMCPLPLAGNSSQDRVAHRTAPRNGQPCVCHSTTLDKRRKMLLPSSGRPGSSVVDTPTFVILLEPSFVQYTVHGMPWDSLCGRTKVALPHLYKQSNHPRVCLQQIPLPLHLFPSSCVVCTLTASLSSSLAFSQVAALLVALGALIWGPETHCNSCYHRDTVSFHFQGSRVGSQMSVRCQLQYFGRQRSQFSSLLLRSTSAFHSWDCSCGWWIEHGWISGLHLSRDLNPESAYRSWLCCFHVPSAVSVYTFLCLTLLQRTRSRNLLPLYHALPSAPTLDRQYGKW